MYIIQTQTEILLQTFDKYEACGFWDTFRLSGIESTIAFNGEIFDFIDPFDYSIIPPWEHHNWDDCEGLEFLL